MNDKPKYNQIVSAPRMDVPGAIILSNQLLSAQVTTPTEGVRKASRRLRSTLTRLRAGWHAREQFEKSADAATANTRLERGWGAFYRRLDAVVMLTVERHPGAERAGRILQLLFPDGLTFTKIERRQKWLESDKCVTLIDEHELSGEIDALAGGEFLAEARAAHAAFGVVLGITGRGNLPKEPPNLAAPLAEVADAIRSYTLHLMAMADGASPEVVAEVDAALAPLDEHRAATRRLDEAAQKPAESTQQDAGAKKDDPPAAQAAPPASSSNGAPASSSPPAPPPTGAPPSTPPPSTPPPAAPAV